MFIKTSIFLVEDQEVKGVKDLPIMPQGTFSNFCTRVPLLFPAVFFIRRFSGGVNEIDSFLTHIQDFLILF